MINYLAVLVAAILNMVISFLWYGPLFGKQWVKLMGFDSKKVKQMKKQNMAKPMALGFISALVMAYILNIFIDYSGASSVGFLGGAIIGFLAWLGFLATTMLGSVLWEGKTVKLYFLNISYQLVSLSIMGAILAL